YHNRWFLDPLFRGSYPQDMLKLYGSLFRPEWVQGSDMATIAERIDFLGVNYYTRGVVQHSDQGVLRLRSVQVDAPRTEMGWEVYPQGLTDLLVRLHADYGGPVMYITENGAAYRDAIAPDGRVHDPERIAYLREHFLAAHRARSEGVDLRGYYVWSFMDNFEWSFGYSKRFGSVYVDYATQRRIPKDSAYWFREVAASGEVNDGAV
ncbi:MAG: beta-glucosidase, partial [Chloroflexota bacterium]